MLSHSIFTSRGNGRSIVSGLAFVLVAGSVILIFLALRGPVGDAIRETWLQLSTMKPKDREVAETSAQSTAFWNAKVIKNRVVVPVGEGSRTTYLYDDGVQVELVRGQGGTFDQTLRIVDPARFQVRLINADSEGRQTYYFRVVYDDRMRVILSQEYADEAAFSASETPSYRVISVNDSNGAVVNDPTRTEVTPLFLKAVREGLDDLRYFSEVAR